MVRTPFEIKQGDTKPWFVVVLKDDFGEETESVVDLSTASTAVFNMRQTGGVVAKISRAPAKITNGTAGEVSYIWGTAGAGTADTNTAGTFQAEIEVGWNDGGIETFPSGPGGGSYWEITITDDIA